MATSGGALHTPPSGPQPSPIQTQKPFVAFNPGNVPPSQAAYLQLNDVIQLYTFTNAPGSLLRFNYRYLTPQGEIKEGELDFISQTAGQYFPIPLGEAWLLSGFVGPITVLPTGSWVYVRIFVGRATAGLPYQTLSSLVWQGYVYPAQTNGFPGNPSKELWDTPGQILSITGATPAAGAEISESMTANRRRMLLSFRFGLLTSATVANRFVGIFIDDGVNELFAIHSSTAETATQNLDYVAAPSSPFFADTNARFIIPLPSPVWLRAGHRIRTATVGLQAGDQYSAPQYLVLEWGTLDA